MIQGMVCSGQGGAARAMVGAKLQERSDAAGVPLVPGTLNVVCGDPAAALSSLGGHSFETDRAGRKLGPLRWWPVWVETETVRLPGWVVRHERTRTRYLEVVSDVRFRDMGVEDGETVTLSGRS